MNNTIPIVLSIQCTKRTLSLARVLEAKTLIVQADSKFIIGQVQGDYEAKEEIIQKYLKIVKELLQYFDSVKFQQIPRAKNAEADFLARLASLDECGISLELCMETRGQPSTEREQVMKIQEQDEWMTPIIHYLKEG